MKIEELQEFARAERCVLILLPKLGAAMHQRDAARLLGLSLRQWYDSKKEGTVPASTTHNGREWVLLSSLADFL